MKVAKLIATLAIMLVSSSVWAVCPTQETTIFFVNGIDTAEKGPGSAEESQQRLGEELLKDPAVSKDCVKMDLAYNTNEPFLLLDLVEGLIQKTAENTGVDNFPWGKWLRAESTAEWFESFVADSIFLPVKGLIETGRFFLGDQRQAHADKYEEQLQLGRQVILVGHSQGNAYANESRGLLSLIQQESTHAVAASALVFPEPDNTRYTSLDQDTLVQGIFALLGAPPFNVVLEEPGPGSCRFVASSSPFYCHAFVKTYMTYHKTRDKIVDDIVALLPTQGGVVFQDDFNRPNSATVGNGWSDTAGNIGGNLAIKNNELTCPSTGAAGTFRPFPFTAPITTTARVKEQSGFGTLLRRYVTRFVVRNSGTLNQGYGVMVVRSDQNFDNSQVILVEDNTQLASIPSTFQYGPEIHVSVTFNLDGSVTGTVAAPPPSTATFSFSFPPRQIQSIGDNFSVNNECSSGPVDQRIDDVVIIK